MEVRFINPGEHRKVQYLRGENILIEINADDDEMKLAEGEVLFSRGVEGGAILPGGCAVVAQGLRQ